MSRNAPLAIITSDGQRGSGLACDGYTARCQGCGHCCVHVNHGICSRMRAVNCWIDNVNEWRRACGEVNARAAVTVTEKFTETHMAAHTHVVPHVPDHACFLIPASARDSSLQPLPQPAVHAYAPKTRALLRALCHIHASSNIVTLTDRHVTMYPPVRLSARGTGVHRRRMRTIHTNNTQTIFLHYGRAPARVREKISHPRAFF
jgi:hypothetical protein